MIYRVAPDGTIAMAPSYHWFDTGQFLLGNFATFRLFYNLWLTVGSAAPDERWRASWSLDPAAMEKWGRRGLALADGNMDKIVELCRQWNARLTLVVYPWPANVLAGDRNSIQVTHWRDWAARHGVRFIDGFAPFFREPAEEAVRKYYIPGDVHFSAAGHRLLFDELRRTMGEF